MSIRKQLQPYIKEIMKEAHEKGTPPMRPLFYDFPEDNQAWDVDDQYLFGHAILVAPVLNEGDRSRTVYLPQGAEWKNAYTSEVHQGGQSILVDAPLEQIPLFIKNNAELNVNFE